MKSLIDEYTFSVKIVDCNPSPIMIENYMELFALEFWLMHSDNPYKSLCSRTGNVEWSDLEQTAEQFNGMFPISFSAFPLISFRTFVRLVDEGLRIPVAAKEKVRIYV